MLYIYNTLTGKKAPFEPLVPGEVSLYSCGITVYDHCHLGHARLMTAFDVIVRYLRSIDYEVNFVRNITDIDDKIINRAIEKNCSIHELTEFYIAEMNKDAGILNLLPPDSEPRATEYIDHIIALIQTLMTKGFAYQLDNGDICYSVEQFKAYGKLSNKDLDSLQSGARITIVKDKHSPLDFVLWKKAKPGEPHWPSPWGEGRPGWHIECSAMAMDKLGEQFDIHGGGLDLKFPHHENEIAQSEACTGKTLANYWMHVGLLQINNEKMSKSTGNFLTIEEALKKHHPEVLRYFLLSSHYRSSLNYTEENLVNAKRALTRLYQSIKPYSDSQETVDSLWQERFNEAMNDDFNTPEALAVLFQLSHEINKTKSSALASTLISLGKILGLFHYSAQNFLQASHDDHNVGAIEALIQQRIDARLRKEWVRADEIRTELLALGIELEDNGSDTTWRLRENH